MFLLREAPQVGDFKLRILTFDLVENAIRVILYNLNYKQSTGVKTFMLTFKL